MSNIKDIVEQVRETPSPRCWDSIASQLLAVGAAAGTSAATGGKIAATATKSALSAGKLAVIIGSTAAVTAGVITSIAVLKNDSVSTSPAPNDNTVAILDDNTHTDSTTFIVEEPIATTENINIDQNTPNNTASTDNAAITPSSSNSTNSPVTTPITPSNSTPTTISHSLPIAQNTAAAPHSNSSTANTPTTEPQPSHQTQNQSQQAKNDNKDDNFDDFDYAKPIKIEIPNIFTPNGDGINDLFVISGIENCQKSNLIVKDHKGKIVLQSQHYDNNWDGNNLPDGTYFYQFAYTINNINEVRRGQLMIRR